jgi:hypothetical protein
VTKRLLSQKALYYPGLNTKLVGIDLFHYSYNEKNLTWEAIQYYHSNHQSAHHQLLCRLLPCYEVSAEVSLVMIATLCLFAYLANSISGF